MEIVPGFVALMYHDLIGPRDRIVPPGRPIQVASAYQDMLPIPLHVPVAEFEDQMVFLAKEGFHILNLNEVKAFYRGVNLPPKSVLLTFDDLYQSVADHAAAVLRYYGFTAVGFVCTEWIFDQPQPRAGDRTVCLSWPELAGLGDVIELANHSASMHTRQNGTAAIETVSQKIFLADIAVAEAKTGRSGIYAYPFGVAPDSAAISLAEAGMCLAFTTQTGTNNADTPPFRLKRILVPPGLGLADFAALLASNSGL